MTLMTFNDARRAVLDGATPEQAARALVATLTPTEKLWCLDGDAPTWAGIEYLMGGNYHRAPFVGGEIEERGLQGIRFSDGPRGAVVGNATAFPVTMARGATWNIELEERIGEAIGQELRAIGANLTGAVCVNLLRHIAWGRAQETYGEDPHHVGELGAALTRGLQQHVMACVKHFALNSMENARFSVDIQVDEIALHEVYLPHFRRIIDEGVASVMSAYNSVNGEWAGQNRPLLTDILRDEWGFKGFVISDWGFGMRDAAKSISAGLDIEMPYRMIRAQHLANELEHGNASWSDVDNSVERIIATFLRFDEVLTGEYPRDILGSPQHRSLAREVASQSIVLLRNEFVGNERVLPFKPSSSVGVFGRLGDQINLGDGGSSDVWDLHCKTIYAGLNDALDNVVYDDGSDLQRASSLASNVEIPVVVVGYTYRDEGEFIGDFDPSLAAGFPPADEPEVLERFKTWIGSQPETVTPPRIEERTPGFSLGGDRTSLRLAPSDVELIRAIASSNPRTIVVIQSGSGVIMSEWVNDVPAVVQAWYGGAEAGTGLSDVLLGIINPSARLPFSIPVNEDDLPPFDRDATSFRYDRWHGWWHLARNNTAPAFPFGFGLSYTTFSLSDPKVELVGDVINIQVNVNNTGERNGADVVQVYATLPDPSSPPRLVGFERVEVDGHGVVTTSLLVPVERLATRDAQSHSWLPASGSHRIILARCATDPDAIVLEIAL